jgi:AcrR family transcriptional regulator
MSDDRPQQGAKCMKKNPVLTAQTRENLMQAFWSLYCQKKIDAITIQEITDTAGYNRSTFYEYFVDIYDVLDQLEESLLAYLKEEAVNLLAEEHNEDFVRGLADLYESKGKYLSVLLGENGDPHFAKKVLGVTRPVLMSTFRLSENDLHTAYILEFGLSACLATITHWYQSNKDLPSRELVGLVHSMLMNGVFPEMQKYAGKSSDPV